jgi:hypothetical protein
MIAGTEGKPEEILCNSPPCNLLSKACFSFSSFSIFSRRETTAVDVVSEAPY